MSQKNLYRLLNPYIEGEVSTVMKANNSFRAAKKIYKNIFAKYVTNHVKDFNFSIQNMNTGKIYHYGVNEKVGKGNVVDYDLYALKGDFSQEINKKLINEVDKLEKMSGGRKHKDDDDDSDSSSSSDSDYYPYSLPINRFVYFYLPYAEVRAVGMNPLDMSKLFLPMFSIVPTNPVYELRFDIYKYYL